MSDLHTVLIVSSFCPHCRDLLSIPDDGSIVTEIVSTDKLKNGNRSERLQYLRELIPELEVVPSLLVVNLDGDLVDMIQGRDAIVHHLQGHSMDTETVGHSLDSGTAIHPLESQYTKDTPALSMNDIASAQARMQQQLRPQSNVDNKAEIEKAARMICQDDEKAVQRLLTTRDL